MVICEHKLVANDVLVSIAKCPCVIQETGEAIK